MPPGPFQIMIGVTPGGDELVYRQNSPQGFELVAAPLDGRRPPVRMLRPGGNVSDAALSPDGRLLAFVWADGGRPEAFVRPFAGGETVRVSADGAWQVRFARDGRTLFYSSERALFAATVTGGATLTVGPPVELFELEQRSAGSGWTDFDVLPDGRFLALVREVDGAEAPLTVVTGWNR